MGMKQLITLCFVFLSLSTPGWAQKHHKGLPAITNYLSEDFHSIGQTWDVTQDNSGIMYFGNTNGILTFDGNTWNTIYPSKYLGIVRALAKNKDGIIYAGSINSFGILYQSEDGSNVYSSLSGQIPANRQSFNDIWQIVCKDDFTFFMSQQSVFVYKSNKLFL